MKHVFVAGKVAADIVTDHSLLLTNDVLQKLVNIFRRRKDGVMYEVFPKPLVPVAGEGRPVPFSN